MSWDVAKCSLTRIDCRCGLTDNSFSDTSSELIARIVVGDRHGAERLRPTQILLVAAQIVSEDKVTVELSHKCHKLSQRIKTCRIFS
jgi:hypothetical protein